MRGRNNKKRLSKRIRTRKQTISLIAYIFVGIIALFTIFASSEFFYSYKRHKESLAGYETLDMYNSFVNKNYGELVQEVTYNEAVAASKREGDDNYYIFVHCYNAVVDYYMYTRAGETEKALDAKKTLESEEEKFSSLFFSDALAAVKDSYKI